MERINSDQFNSHMEYDDISYDDCLKYLCLHTKGLDYILEILGTTFNAAQSIEIIFYKRDFFGRKSIIDLLAKRDRDWETWKG